MFKKFNVFLFVVGLSALMFSCNKDMSPDLPLPDVRKKTVFITTNSNRLYGYDAETGQKTWEKSLKGKMSSSPLITDDALFVFTEDGDLYGWDLKTQEQKFSPKKLFSVSPNNSLAGMGNLIFVPSDSLYCFDTDGNRKWAYGSGAGPATTAVTLFNNRIYVGFGMAIRCLDDAGNMIWQSTANDIITTTLKATTSALFFGTADYKMQAIDITNGAYLWTYTTSSNVLSAPLVYGGMSISGSDDNNIYCVDMQAGAGQQGLLRWSVPTKERVRSSPAIHIPTNTVLVGCHDYFLYAIDHVSGTVKWKYPTGSLISSSPVILGNKAYFASYDKYLYCIDVRFGDLLWKTNMDFSADGSPIIDNVTNEAYNGASGMSTN